MLTPEAKQLLSKTIRDLRALLLESIRSEADGRYRLSLPLEKAGLAEEPRKRRERLEAWLDERIRATAPQSDKEREAARERFLKEAVKEAAATLLNRLVLLRHLEALELVKPAVVTRGWNSKAYRELRDFAPALLGDETQGYELLLRLTCDELALDLPGLFGDVGLTRLFPVPPATLREAVERLDAEALASAWTDDTTLGWVYQYWNDPEREALDAKINDGGKIEPHEIASKTQMFTERYMVEWLLHNSLGLTWLCICKKHGWTADAEAVLPVLDARRAEWRAKRDAGEVALDALMPISGEREEHWKYYVPQPIPEDAVAGAPDSVRQLKLLDPACGSGHFLVIAFDLLAAMYREEARHRGEELSDREIAESILENNLHGIDIDPRAVQIAAAAVVLKAKRLSREARPRRVNLVAPVLRLGSLPDDDPSLVRLRSDVKKETGIPEELTDKVIKALAGVDHLGSLLKVDAAIDEAIRQQETLYRQQPSQKDWITGQFPEKRVRIDADAAKETLQERLEQFLARHTHEEDLGLRLSGEQLAAGLRFVRMVKEGSYDLVVGNPPYQGLGKTSLSDYVAKNYPKGKADLYAAFLERGLRLAREGGLSALLTMRGWMFLRQFEKLREHLLHAYDLRSIGDVDRGAFEDVPDEVLATVMTVFRQHSPIATTSVAIQPTPPSDRSRDGDRTNRKRSAMLAQVGRFDFSTDAFKAIEGEPVVYWWSDDFLKRYADAPKLGETAPGRAAQSTGNNSRFTRNAWEIGPTRFPRASDKPPPGLYDRKWQAFINGAESRCWIEPLLELINWQSQGLEIKLLKSAQTNRDAFILASEDWFLRPGIAFTMIGSHFAARAHRYASIMGNKGSSVFPDNVRGTLCLMNSSTSRWVLESLNPGVGFEVGDVNRLPIFPTANSQEIVNQLESSFEAAESSRESSLEFLRPSLSSWRYAQAWAQAAVDQSEEKAPLPEYAPEFDPPRSQDHVSFYIGVALGRFGANGEGILTEAPPTALPHGILFLSAATDEDSLKHPACTPILESWKEHGAAIAEGTDLRTWVRKDFFAHHKSVYENRPIYFPLSSARKSFVAWVSIHRWSSNTLSSLLADHLLPERRRLEGELDDLRLAKTKGGKAKAERRFAEVQKLLAELTEFIDSVTECAERGPPPTASGETPRERDARYEMDLDDGVMINSAALWPLLEPQWKDPKKWWKELATAKGRKDYDWAHLARRYFPERVEKKCHEDPSLAVAHGCFWRLHPAKAYAWELRLQDEIRPDFTIDEQDSDERRKAFLDARPDDAAAIRAKETERRERKARKSEPEDENLSLPLGEAGDDDSEEVA